MRIFIFLSLAAFGYAYTDLETKVLDALREASENIQTRQQFETEDATKVQSQKATDAAKLEQLRGDLLSEATRILIAKYGTEILPELEEIDVEALMMSASSGSRKKRYVDTQPTTSCKRRDDSNCGSSFNSKFRSVTGICNNQRIKEFGQAVRPTRRLLNSAGYSDGVNAIRTKSSDRRSYLPSTRLVSNKLHDEGASLAYDFMTNHLMMQFGQMIAHDIVFTPSSVGPKGETLDCSEGYSSFITDNCAPIPVPSDDSYFPRNGYIRLTRALNAQRSLGVRQPVDQNTHFIDMSIVYGSEECEAASVRLFRDGLLKTFDKMGYPLPPQNKNDSNCQSTDPYFCFTAGDFRNCLHPGLVPFHVLYIRQHNMLAKAISAASRRALSDEEIYQQARKINIAQFQHHVYNEYLPKLLGDKTMKEFNLYPLKSTFFREYDDSLRTSPLTYEFTAAAFRFGHSQSRRDHPRTDNSNKTSGSALDIGSNIFYADGHYDKKAGGTEAILHGMMNYPAMAADRYFSFPIRNQLFEIRGKKASGVDLVAVNIMRGRDVGLHPYNMYRQKVGLKKATSFNDLLSEMSAANVKALQSVYATVDDIDLYPGLLMEKPANGAMLGRTGAYIIAESFRALKYSDRFYYESDSPSTEGFTMDQLNAIRATTLSRVLCESTDTMTRVNKDIFDLNSSTVSCNDLKPLDMKPFTGR